MIKDLSSGNRTLLRFLNLRLNDYDLLILDEPSNYLDPDKVGILIDIVTSFVTRRKCYCVISSHDPRFYEDSAFQNKKSCVKYLLSKGKILEND